MNEVSYLAALVLGLMGAGHCIGMCGGIINALSFTTSTKKVKKKWVNLFAYQFGRIMSYSTFGLLGGLMGQQIEHASTMPILKITSGVLLILMGLYLSRIWMLLTYLEKFGHRLWSKISPLSKKLLPVRLTRQALLLGVLWGWLPCGLVYSSLGFAITEASPLNSALFMFAFGVGTLPATLLVGTTSLNLKRWLNLDLVRYTVSTLYFLYGIWVIYAVFALGNSELGHHH